MNTQQFPTQLQNAAHILERLAQVLDAANTDNGGIFPLYLAERLMESGRPLESITLGELQNMAQAARTRADQEARLVRELCANY